MSMAGTGGDAGRLASLARDLLPRGRQLPERVWWGRHRGIVILLWLHAAFIPLFAFARGYKFVHVALETGIVPACGILAAWPALSRRMRTTVASIGLLACSGVLVHLSGGVIEMHFHFFVMVTVVALYQDWLPFLAAIAFVFVHHGLIGALDPESVYNHPAAWNNPWKWAGIHAFFIAGSSIACLISWRLNERSLADREVAEERLREESRIVETVHEVGNTLAEDLDTSRVMQAVTHAATRLTDAAFGAFFYNDVNESGEMYQLLTLSGAPIEAFTKFGMPRNTDVFKPTFTGESVIRLDDVTQDVRYGNNPPHHGMPKGHLPVRSYLAVPVRSRTGEVLGGLFFGHPEVGRFTEVHERLAVGTAAQAAIALDNARLYQAERRARMLSDAATARFALLADVSQVLASSLEIDTLLSELSSRISTGFTDCCCIDLVDDDGKVRRATTASRHVLSTSIDRHARPATDAIRAAIDTCTTQFTDDARFLCDPTGTHEHATGIVVPLVSRKAVLGTVSFVSHDGGLTPDDIALCEELARRAALAVENASLFVRQRSVADVLQHSLLPEHLPDVPGLITAARYRPGGPDVEIGGDWYDMLVLPGGRIALTIGDVVGRGERAASLMGQLRNAQRAYALEGKSPALVAEQLNALLTHLGPEHMATLFFGVLDPESGELRYVNAGHPPPLVAETDGTTRFIDGTGGVPMGATNLATYQEARTVLAPGSTLVLYTDGLIEDRAESLQVGLDALCDAVREGPRPLDDLAGWIVDMMLRDRNADDDAAVLLLQLAAFDGPLHFDLPGSPAVLAPLRATMRRWLRSFGTSEADSYEILAACGEACANAIRHAGGPSRACFQLDASFDGEVVITVRNEGPWRAPRQGVGGRGLAIIEGCMDDVTIDRQPASTTVTMRRRMADLQTVMGS